MSNRVRGALAAALLALGVGGCVDSMPDFQASAGNIRAASGASPRAATVAMTSLDGVPDPVASRFNQSFAKEAAAREITIVGPSAARFLVKGYMSAYPAENGGTAVSFVYDIFDAADQRRVDRVSDVLTLPQASEDPWALVDDRVAGSVAARSADVLATALAASDSAQAPHPTLVLATQAAPN